MEAVPVTELCYSWDKPADMGWDIKNAVIGAGLKGIVATGMDRWLAPMARGRGVILTFHHVRPARSDPFQPNGLLEVTPAHLARTIDMVRDLGFEIVPLDEVPARIAGEGPRFCALTFDDGYRDNADHAAPILAARGCPWTLFVTADYASGHGRLWWLELEEVVRRRRRMVLTLRGATVDEPAGTPEEKRRAFKAVYCLLRSGPEDVLREVIAGWCREDGIEPDALVRELCLGWDDLEALAGDPNVAFGAHTLSHPMLAKHDPSLVWLELEGSRAAIESRLGRPVRHVAYPVGDPSSAGPREFRMARELGFATGLTTRPGHLFAEHAANLTALPRVSVNGLYQTPQAIRSLLSGVPFLAWNRGRRIHARSG